MSNIPKGVVVAGMGGGSGKSVVAVGIAAAMTEAGRKIVPFKKGPDYIDAGWLAKASDYPCYNLDQYLMTPEAVAQSVAKHIAGRELVVVEGNRGLYDGVDAEGSFSTAELAKTLGLPIILVVDCTKVTRTVAAFVLGCKMLDPDVTIAGVVLNRIGTARHEKVVREAVEKYAGIPVVGAIRRSKEDVFPQRHLGVTPAPEHDAAGEAIQTLAAKANESLDLAAIEGLMQPVAVPLEASVAAPVEKKVRIGVLKDAAFQFYYAENLEGLVKQGAELVEVNALTAQELPELDGLYIGGGFPETSARALSANVAFRNSLKDAADKGLPIYAECGGLIYLGESMELEGEVFPLCGIFPVRYGLRKKPQAHGYTVLTADRPNPYYGDGTEISGHEFRYSTILSWDGKSEDLAFTMQRGVGFVDGRDGLVYKNVLALYTHIHAAGTPQWARLLVEKATAYKKEG